MTKLYFHATASGISGTLPSSEQSTLTAVTSVDAQTVNRSMNTRIGTAQTSIALTSNATVSAQDYYFTKFVSDTLSGISSITAQTWNYAFAATESNASANYPVSGGPAAVYINVYVWRPSTGAKVGTILDGNTSAFVGEATSGEASHFGTFSGSLVSSVSDGDVIICEIWFRITQAAATAYTDTFYFDGTTETNSEGSVVSNHASYIETPQTLTFPSTRLYFHAATSSVSGTLPSTEQSTLTAADNFEANQATNRVMDTTIGTAQTSLANASLAQTSATDYYIARWVSPLINQTSLQANTWTYNFAAQESNTQANFPVSGSTNCYVNCYVWKPSNGTKYGTILDGNTGTGFTEPSLSAEKVLTGSFTGSAVSSLTANDAVIVFEAWARVTQGSATSYTQTYFFDGTTVTLTSGTTVSNHASFIETPEIITFGGGAPNNVTKSLTEGITISDSLADLSGKTRPPAATETLTIDSGTPTKLTAKIRTRTDPITLTDSPAKLLTKNKSNTETTTISDSLVRVSGRVRNRWTR